MDNIRNQLIAAMREKLAGATRNQPGSMAMAVPLGPLADAALSVLAGGAEIPTVPKYNADLMVERRWYGTLGQEEIEEGALFGSASLRREGDYVHLLIDYDAQIIRLKLPPHEAADFGLNVVSAAYADDPAEQKPSDETAGSGVQAEGAAEEHVITEIPRLIEGDEGESGQ
jgi:hypothetical protein